MPARTAPKKSICVRVRLTIIAEMDERFSDPLNEYGLRYGSRSAFIDKAIEDKLNLIKLAEEQNDDNFPTG